MSEPEMSEEEVTPSRPRLHPLWRVVLYLVLCLVALGGAGYLFFRVEPILPMWARTGVLRYPGADPQSPEMGLAYVWMATGAMLLATAVMTAVVERRPLRSAGFQWGSGVAGEVGLGLVLGAALQTGIVGIAWLCGWAALRAEGPAGEALVLGALLLVPAALIEELSVRGYVLPTLSEAWGGRTALLVTSLFFGALHSLNPGASPLAFLGTTAAGVMLGLAYQRTGRLWLPWALHFAWNFAEGSLWGMPVSGVEAPSVLRTQLHGPVLWTGGAFGPEAGLLGLIAVILGIVLLERVLRRGTSADVADERR
jgi:membrane protease YdiL (CAAX protease family)